MEKRSFSCVCICIIDIADAANASGFVRLPGHST